MTDHMPTGDLRERLAQALYEWAVGHTAGGARFLMGGTDEHLRENSLARADAVLSVVEAETAALRQRAEQAEAAVQRVRRLQEMTIASSCRAGAIEQAEDTLRLLDGPEAK